MERSAVQWNRSGEDMAPLQVRLHDADSGRLRAGHEVDMMEA